MSGGSTRGNPEATQRRRPWQAILLAAALVLALVAGVLYRTVYLPDRRTDDRARAEAAEAAADGAVALLTYTPETTAADLAAAGQRLTGEFKDYYGRVAESVLVPAAREQKISTHASVTDTGIGSFDADSAVALVFLTQTSTSADRPEPVTASVGARVELSWVDDQWLISRFDAG
ncbi:twin-arginine translocation pathway signal [Rhodococcus kronopolitis]|uniref:Twin-arginine translocation pathway signal n=1 Tax=Rhodococcus kronopolitis TaxID=1460226 RepID=A0ABV9FSJ3_9NOCA